MKDRRCGNSLRRGRPRRPGESLPRRDRCTPKDKPFHRFNELSFLSQVYRIRRRPSSKRNAPPRWKVISSVRLTQSGANGGWYFAAVLAGQEFSLSSSVVAHTTTLSLSLSLFLSLKFQSVVACINFANSFLRKLFYSTQLRHCDIYLSKVNLLNLYFLPPYMFSSSCFSLCVFSIHAETGNVPQLSRRETNEIAEYIPFQNISNDE